jgi:hypothetical protein
MKTKESKMRFLLLSFIFINFSESSLFSGLRPKKIKKFARRLTRLAGCTSAGSESAFCSPYLHAPAKARALVR